MLDQQSSYKKPIVLSLLLHAILAAVLLIDITFSHRNVVFEQGNNKVELIQAVAVNQAQQVAKQQQLVQQREQQEQQRLAELKQQQQEQQRIEKVKQQNAAQEHQREHQLEQQRIQQKQLLVKQQELAKQQANEAAKKQQELAKQQAAEAAKKRQALLAAKLKAQALAKRKAAAIEAANEAKLEQELAAKEAQSARIQGEVNKYQALIKHAIEQQWLIPPNVDKSLMCKFQIQLAPGGAVLNVTLLSSSGDPALDRSAQTAIYKASPLPVPSDTEAFNVFRSFVVKVRPQEALADG